jgi:hypothetical protein
MSEQPYDPYIPSGSNANAAGGSTAQNGDNRTREIDRVSARYPSPSSPLRNASSPFVVSKHHRREVFAFGALATVALWCFCGGYTHILYRSGDISSVVSDHFLGDSR